jgi:hypothetical protein
MYLKAIWKLSALSMTLGSAVERRTRTRNAFSEALRLGISR